jgi:hypothetical protein
MNNDFADIGEALVDYSREAEFSAQQSVMEELFPSVFVASKRMSLRAISIWLDKTQKVKITPMTLSRAMRAADKYWKIIANKVEPAARLFAAAHKVSMNDILSNQELITQLLLEPPIVSGEDHLEEIWEVEKAAQTLHDSWFRYPVEARAECWKFIDMGTVKRQKRKKE